MQHLLEIPERPSTPLESSQNPLENLSRIHRVSSTAGFQQQYLLLLSFQEGFKYLSKPTSPFLYLFNIYRRFQHCILPESVQNPRSVLPPSSILSSTMNINSLPDDCLRSIFHHLQLQEQLYLRLICRQWRNLLELMFHDSGKSLKLFGSELELETCRKVIHDKNLDQHEDFRLGARSDSCAADDCLIIRQVLP